MQFCVLGPMVVAAEGPRGTIGSDRQRTILAVLLVARGDTVSPDRLVDAVWGERPPPTAHKSLHSHISRLRRTLAILDPAAPEPVVTEASGYRVDLERHDLDADRFEVLVGQAGEDLAADPGRAVRLLEEALGMWRGPAFGELAFHEVVWPEALRLEELRSAAAADRVDALLALGRHDEVIGELQALVATDPLAERPHGQLMVALYRAGRQADALAIYRSLRERLVEELGVDPSPALQHLDERILRQDADLAAPERTPFRTGAGAPAGSQLRGEQSAPTTPALASGLIGRDDDIAAVGALVTAAPLVTLTGTGGVGKTRLAEAVTAQVGEQFSDGVAVCSLTAVRDRESLVAALIGALGIQHQGSRSVEEALLAALGTRRLLLVLDNCEHVLDAVSPLVDRMRGECPNVAVLVTSREYLHLSEERVWDVSPLRVPLAGATATEVAEAPAGALFRARAQEVEPGFTLTDGNAAAVAEVCRRLDGIPLAIELAAARLRAMTPFDLAERLDDRFRLLTGGPHRDAGRHRTLEAVVEWSYELLTETEARLFDRLSVFAGSFTLTAAEHVCIGDGLAESEIAGAIAELVDKSMVAVERGDDQVRYRLLDTLHDYGTQRLSMAGTANRYRRAHAVYYVGRVEQLAPRLRGRDERAALADVDATVDNLRIAHTWLTAAGDVDGALRLPVALHDYVHYRLRDEMVTWAERALDLPGAQAHPLYAAALATAGRGAMSRGQLGHARRHAEVALARADHDDLAALWALHVLTEVALYEGRLDDSLALTDRRSALARRLGQDYYLALAGASRTLAHVYRGDADAAIPYAADAMEAADACGNQTARAWALYAHGEALLDIDPPEAAKLLEQAIDAAKPVDSRLAEGVALVSLASVLGRTGETGNALERFREVIVHWRRLGDHTHQLTTLRNLVELLARVSPDERAAMLYGAVTTGPAPSFGVESERLVDARNTLWERLGTDVVDAAVERGRRLTLAQTVDEALVHLDALRGG